MRRLPSSPLTDPDVRISRIRFLAWQVRSRTPAEGVNDSRLWQSQPLQHAVEFHPRQASQAVAAFEPLLPDPTHVIREVLDAAGVADDPIVGIVAPQQPAAVSSSRPETHRAREDAGRDRETAILESRWRPEAPPFRTTMILRLAI